MFRSSCDMLWAVFKGTTLDAIGISQSSSTMIFCSPSMDFLSVTMAMAQPENSSSWMEPSATTANQAEPSCRQFLYSIYIYVYLRCTKQFRATWNSQLPGPLTIFKVTF